MGQQDSADSAFVEASFLVPLRGDKAFSDGDLHSTESWDRLNSELFSRFEAYTWAPGEYSDVYRDPDTRNPVADESRKCILALPESALEGQRQLLSIVAVLFHQKVVYLSVAGRVEFIERPNEIDHEAISRFGRSDD